MTTPHLMLENDLLLLKPLESSHDKVLWPIAQKVDLHRFGSTDVSSPEKLSDYIKKALQEASDGKSIPFTIYNKQTSKYVGSTRFGHIDTKNKTLHIGWTWISPETRSTGFNHQMKFLMLRHAFETMDFEKVEFRIDERNIISRKAVEKLGATLEGILRKNIIVKDGFRRSSCCYGIIKDEWQSIKKEKFSNLL